MHRLQIYLQRNMIGQFFKIFPVLIRPFLYFISKLNCPHATTYNPTRVPHFLADKFQNVQFYNLDSSKSLVLETNSRVWET
jgi:hypothetical protein